MDYWADGERETPKGRPYLPSNHATVRILILILIIIMKNKYTHSS